MADRPVATGRGWVAVLVGASTAVALAEVALPATLGRVVDQALAARGPGPTPAPGWAATGVALVALRVVGEALADLAGGRASARATSAHRRALLRHAFDTGPGLADRFPPGELCSRVVGNAVEGGRSAVAVANLVATAVPAVGGAVALGLLDPWLLVTFLVGSVVAGWLVRTFFRTTTEVASRYLGAQAAIASRLVDALAGARTIAAARTVEREVDRALAPLPDLQGQGRAAWRALAQGAWQAATVAPAVQVAVLAVAGTLLAGGRLSAGEVMAAGWYAAAGAGIGDAVAQLAQLARARAARARLDEVLAAPVPRHGGAGVPDGPGTLELRAVTVDARGERLLDGLGLVVPAGCAVAVVGRSAAAVGAVAAVAGRLRDPDGGDVLLDGVPLPRLSRRALRRAVTYGFGRPVLLGDTVADAIAFGAGAAPPDAVRAAARAARADAFIERLAAGYDTPLADAPMSGGEAQRVGLARAFAHAGRVVVLDDATSSLDTATEQQVTGALTHRLADRARLVVAHRAATAAQADLVAWVDGGRVRAVAPHAELWEDPDYRAVFAADPGAEG